MKKEISIIEGTKDRYSLKIDGVFIEKSDMEKIEIDKNNFNSKTSKRFIYI